MFVSDLRHFLDIPDDAPGPARMMAEHLGFMVRVATAGEAGAPWVSALTCRRRPGNRPCGGHIALFRAHLPAPIEWRCNVCGDEGVISGWEDSPFDLTQPRSRSHDAPRREIALADPLAATLRDLRLLDTYCERLVFGMRSVPQGIVLTAGADDLEELVGFVAAEANHETNRRRQKCLDEAFAVLSGIVSVMDSGAAAPPTVETAGRATAIRRDAEGVTGRWRIVEMELWESEDLDLVAPAFIEFQPDRTGSFGFIVVSGSMDWRSEGTDHRRVEFSWDGTEREIRSAVEGGPLCKTTGPSAAASTSTSATLPVFGPSDADHDGRPEAGRGGPPYEPGAEPMTRMRRQVDPEDGVGEVADLWSAETADDLHRVLALYPPIRRSSDAFEPSLFLQKHHEIEPSTSAVTAMLLVTDRRWRGGVGKLVHRIAESDIVDEEQLDRIARTFLAADDAVYWQVPDEWFGEDVIVIDLGDDVTGVDQDESAPDGPALFGARSHHRCAGGLPPMSWRGTRRTGVRYSPGHESRRLVLEPRLLREFSMPSRTFCPRSGTCSSGKRHIGRTRRCDSSASPSSPSGRDLTLRTRWRGTIRTLASGRGLTP